LSRGTLEGGRNTTRRETAETTAAAKGKDKHEERGRLFSLRSSGLLVFY
jgi:hypothetical protein